jgi:hypothetical protein
VTWRFGSERTAVIRRLSFLAALAAAVMVEVPRAAAAQTTSSSSGLNPAVLLVPSIVFAVICGILANSKGRSVAGWAALGFFFGLIPLIILAFLKNLKGQPPAPPMGGTFGAPPPPPPPPPPPG